MVRVCGGREWFGRLTVSAEINQDDGELRGEFWRDVVPDVVGLGESVDKEERGSTAAVAAENGYMF